MEIRTAELSDLDAIARVEAECFPQAEAATREDFEKRLAAYRNHFWLLADVQGPAAGVLRKVRLCQ